MRRTATALVFCVAGCGRIGFDDHFDAGAIDAPTGPCADIEALGDDFADGVPDPEWTEFANPPVDVAETNGTFVITLASATVAYGGYLSMCRFDARNKRVHVEILEVPNAPSAGEMYLELQLDADNRLGITTHSGLLAPFRRIASNYVDNTSPFTLAQQRHWQLREANGTMFWETSPDAVTWTVQRMELTPIDLSSVTLVIAAGTYQPTASPGRGVFDNVNLP